MSHSRFDDFQLLLEQGVGFGELLFGERLVRPLVQEGLVRLRHLCRFRGVHGLVLVEEGDSQLT